MSSSKRDRSIAPRTSSRPSRARHVGDRNVKPPAGYRPAGKRKPGERAMEAQLAASAAEAVPSDVSEGGPAAPLEATPAPEPAPPGAGVAVVVADPDDVPPPADPWWTAERERAYDLTLQGLPQHQVAAELGRDRHTIARWLENEKFADRLHEENVARFRARGQRRSIQTVRLTDKAEVLATKMLNKAIKLADEGKDDLGTRLAARDWLQEFRENSRREDEIYGLDRQRVDVNVNGRVDHQHRGRVDVSFKAFLATSLRGMGVDPDVEEVDAGRADEALATITERALAEGSFLDDLVKREREQQLAPMLAGDRQG